MYHTAAGIAALRNSSPGFENAGSKFSTSRTAPGVEFTRAAATPANTPVAPAPVCETVRRFDELVKRHEQMEAETILNSLQACQWNRKRAAEQLGIDYKALLYKVKKLNIGLPARAGARQDHGPQEFARA